MYIEPNSTIRLLHNVPLDDTYNHTIYFANKDAQAVYFGQSSLVKYTFNQQSYQRVNRGTMRIQIKADDIYDCNYLAFRNDNFGSKWFYAFITKIEYVNNITSEVTYVIDDMQTYMFDVTIKECFVEREHSTTDGIGDNIVDEELHFGYYVTKSTKRTNYFKSWDVVVSTGWDVDSGAGGAYLPGGIYQGIYSGLYYKVFNVINEDGSINNSGVADLNEWLISTNNSGAIDDVISLTFMPHIITAQATTYYTPVDIRYHYFGDDIYTDLDGYVPKNNKLFTYPYNLLYISSDYNKGITFKYEQLGKDLGTNNVEFKILGSNGAVSEMILTPVKYLGRNDNLQYSIGLGSFPQCAFSSDVFKEYLALNSNKISTNIVGGVMSTAFGAASLLTGGLSTLGIGAAVGGILSLGNTVSSMADEANKPQAIHGTQNSDVLSAHKMKDFYFEHRTINGEYAKIIDNYFTMYGYATKRVKVPNNHARTRWTYTKTVGCVAVGNAPADAIRHICQIYDNGITFWANIADMDVGNYSKDNPVIV